MGASTISAIRKNPDYGRPAYSVGQSTLGQTTTLSDPLGFTVYRPPLALPVRYAGLAAAVERVMAGGISPVVVVTRGEASFDTWT